MKPKFAKPIPFLFLLALAVWLVAPRASAQTPAGLDLRLYAGLSITGAAGTVYSVEYVTDLGQTNAWRTLEFLKLPNSPSPHLWHDRSAPATGRRFYRAVQFDAPTNMVFIPAGTFRMGSPTNEVDRATFEGPQMTVAISQGFWMGKYEVTQGEYLELMHTNPSYFAGDNNRPVELVSWNDATSFCAQLSERERAAGRIATNSVYRLPTSAEWEYACRALTSDRQFSYGDDPHYTNLINYAWYSANSEATTHPVGQKLPNPWGLYDMYGNVQELCQDWSGVGLPGGTVMDPQGPASGLYRTLRNGDWINSPNYCRSAAHYNDILPYDRFTFVGFRIVLAPGQP